MTERVALGEEDFRTLVSGGVVKQRSPGGVEVEILLLDIGWDRMEHALEAAWLGRRGVTSGPRG